jgi:hypothetical protein
MSPEEKPGRLNSLQANASNPVMPQTVKRGERRFLRLLELRSSGHGINIG